MTRALNTTHRERNVPGLCLVDSVDVSALLLVLGLTLSLAEDPEKLCDPGKDVVRCHVA